VGIEKKKKESLNERCGERFLSQSLGKIFLLGNI
jgi:hypothetical protein